MKSGPQPVESSARAEVANPWAERRRSPRYSLTAPAEVTEIKSKTVVGGRCTDLSVGGCYIDTLNPFPKGTEVRVRIVQEPRSFLSEAIVAFGQAGMGMGLAFYSMAPGESRKLAEWLLELSCASLPSPAAAEAGANTAQQAETADSGRNVLNALISLLIRKRVLTDQEATELLRELFH